MSDGLFGKLDDVKAKQRRKGARTAGADVAARAAHDDTADVDEVAPIVPPAPPIPEHLRKYLVDAPRAEAREVTAWRSDYDHTNPPAPDPPRYPDGLCGRPDCLPCRLALLERGDGQDWPGRARMATARHLVGLPLDELDTRALNRAAAPADQ